MDEIYLMNPKRRRRRKRATVHHRRRSRRRRNSELALFNPGKRRRRNVRRRSYYVYARPSRRRRYGFMGNPALLPGLDLTLIGAGGAGAIGSRMLASKGLELANQVDSGIIGYVATFGAGFLLSKVAGMILKNKKLENGILLGAGIATITRIVDDVVIKKQGLSEILGLGSYVPDSSLNFSAVAGAGGGRFPNRYRRF
jgi:hypothetical protein